MAAPIIVGAADAGGVDNGSIQAFFCGVQHQLGGLGFAFGIIPHHLIRVKMIDLRNGLSCRSFGDGMDGTNVHQLGYGKVFAAGKDIAGPLHVDVKEAFLEAGANGDHAGAVDQLGGQAGDRLKKGGEGIPQAYIALHDLSALHGRTGPFTWQDQCPDLLIKGQKRPDHRIAQMAGGASDQIECFFHTHPSFSQYAQSPASKHTTPGTCRWGSIWGRRSPKARAWLIRCARPCRNEGSACIRSFF